MRGFVFDAGAFIALERRVPLLLGILDEALRGTVSSHPDIVDVHVALVAAERGHAVLTSDDADIAGVNPDLVVVHV